LDSSFLYFEAVIVRINKVCLGLGDFYGLYITPWVAFNVINEFVISKGVIHLGERIVRED